MNTLEVRNIRKRFGSTTVLDNVSFRVEKGELVVLLGPSGCGKTTMLRIIAGLERQDEGYVYIGGQEVTDLSPKMRDIAMVFQSYALYPHMTVYENIAFPLKMRKYKKNEIDRRVRDAAELLRIQELLDRKPKELSGGQRQRVAIGRAIVRSPKVFLFDEPLSNLDAQLRASMRVELRRLHDKIGSTSVYVTHDQVEAMTLADRIIILQRGCIQQIGTPEEIYSYPTNLFVATFVGMPGMNLIEGRVALREGIPCFVSDDLCISLSEYMEYKSLEGKEVVLGLRPEALKIGDGDYKAEVRHVENLGSEKIVYLECSGKELVCKTSIQINAGEQVRFGIAEHAAHLFYKGERVSKPTR